MPTKVWPAAHTSCPHQLVCDGPKKSYRSALVNTGAGVYTMYMGNMNHIHPGEQANTGPARSFSCPGRQAAQWAMAGTVQVIVAHLNPRPSPRGSDQVLWHLPG